MSPIRRSKCALAALVSVHGAFAQSFVIADVHTVAPAAKPVLTGFIPQSNRLELRGATMVDLIRIAWNTGAERVVGGPAWLAMDRYDVVAQAPVGSTRAAVNVMLQALLTERFSLVVHDDTRDLRAFVMTVAKSGPKMKKSDSLDDGGCDQPAPKDAEAPQSGPSYVTYVCRNTTVTAFAQLLPGLGPGYFRGTRLVDETKLDGPWDFTVRWTGRGQVAAAGADGITLFDATEKQLGLHIELGKAALPVIVVDSVNEKPTANLPGVREKLPERPKEFEVAVIKPSAPGSTRSNISFRNDRVNIENATLKDLLTWIWDLADDRIVGMPSFAETDRYDVVAKAPADGETDFDSIQAMTQALLKDRFRITTHNEDRPIDVWMLVASKPKLTKADPGNRSGCRNVASTSVILTRSVACQNTSMAQFAAWLEHAAPGYTRQHPVIDATGIDGAWDFTLNFSNMAMTQGGPSGISGPADPNGAVSLFAALEKQLGLKLRMQKRPMPVLVIDHIDSKPTDN